MHEGPAPSQDLEKLLEIPRRVKLSQTQKEEQRRSFAYGNASIGNGRITKEMVAREAEVLSARGDL